MPRAAGHRNANGLKRRSVMKKIASNAVVTACTQRVNAIGKYLGAKDTLFVGGEQMKASDLVKVFQTALDTRATAVTAKGAYNTTLAARNTAEATRLAVDEALQPYVVQRFGATSTEAHDFGYTPKKVAEKTPATKAKAALLGQATREARGTKSKKAKQGIKGSLSPETSAALEALSGSAASPTAAASPAASAASPPVAAPVVAAPAVTNGATNGATLNGTAHS
jgi:hypothetical protein